jgi:hypothetical protein
MSQALIVRDRSIEVSDHDREITSRVMTSGLRGIDERNHKRWIRFLKNVFGLEHGEIAEIGTRIPRSGPFHRFHMAIEQAVFNAQDRFTQFEQFRNWTKVGSGFCDWCAGPKGGVIPVPRSISYADLEEDPMREFHEDMLAFFRGEHAANYLWPHLKGARAAEMMDAVLREFDK